ncbi:MAG: glycosyltransferase family 1 protein [Planctomycetota bacterium]|nr:glycosyltransferase family 1 protein [Planctomycetota bacterium]
MLVGLEASAACRPIPTGVARYATRLIRELASAAVGNEQITAYVRISRRFEEGHRIPDLGGVPWKYYPDPLPPAGPLPDVLHGLEVKLPMWSSWRGRHSRIVTLHDLIAVLGEDLSDQRCQRRNRKRYDAVAKRADHVLAVSNRTRTDFLERYDFDPDRVHVTHLGVDERFRPCNEAEEAHLRQARDLHGPFLLYVGDATPRKNLLRLIEAYGRSDASRDLRLVLAGAIGAEDGAVADALRRCPARDRIQLLGYVTEDELLTLYGAAEALLFPTLYEGFGLPVLEAFASGTAVLGADVGAVPEVAGGHATLVDPRDVDSIAAGIDRVITSTSPARDEARRHAGEFTWRRCAERTLEVYRHCRKNGSR